MERPAASAPKAAWRAWAAGVDVDWAAASAAIVPLLDEWLPNDVTVVAFHPMKAEVDLRPLFALPGRRWLITRTPPEGSLTLHDAANPLERHRYGFAQPRPNVPQVSVDEVDIVLVPGVAFSTGGTRLGHGSGYYDEFLARCPARVRRIGVNADALVVDALPSADHDQAMTHLATESGVRPAR